MSETPSVSAKIPALEFFSVSVLPFLFLFLDCFRGFVLTNIVYAFSCLSSQFSDIRIITVSLFSRTEKPSTSATSLNLPS